MANYEYPMALTQQFKFCGNAFRVDMYRGCNFGCNYCFANYRQGKFNTNWAEGNLESVGKAFTKAFESEKEYKDVTIELLRHRVPLHLGGMSDPFQPREKKHRLTYQLIELSKKYNYPMLISTKAASLPEDYWAILDPKIHAFQVSLIGLDDAFVLKYDRGAPLASKRIAFMQELKARGFWVGMRLQPMLDLEQALKLIEVVNPVVNYITVEHLKIPSSNKEVSAQFSEQLKSGDYIKPKQGVQYELKHELKIANIKRIQAVAIPPVGVGDNDLHELSESTNCCGVDLIGEAFNNWLKYNYTYFVTTGNKEEEPWSPKSSVRSVFNSHTRGGPDYVTVPDYVDRYIEKFEFNILGKEDVSES